MLSRRRLLGTLSASLLGWPRVAWAQPAGAKLWRIGFLGAETLSTNRHFFDAFRLGMRDHGYVEGQSVTIEQRWAGGQRDRFRDLINDLIRSKSDVLLISSTSAALAAKDLTSTIPIVFVAGDPTGSGLVSNLARPGGNVTGVSLTFGDDLAGKSLELLAETVPRLARVAVLSNPLNPASASRFRALQQAADKLRIRVRHEPVSDPTQLDNAFAAMSAARAQALVVLADPFTVHHRRRISDLAAIHRLPAMYGFRDFADAGGLMAYGANVVALYRRAATYVDKILKGGHAGDIPVEEATQFELVINLKTAKALGLTIPPSLLLRADQVIE